MTIYLSGSAGRGSLGFLSLCQSFTIAEGLSGHRESLQVAEGLFKSVAVLN